MIDATGKGERRRRSSEDEWEKRRAYIRAREIVEIPRFSSMRARNERENKSKKEANYWSTWRKTKDAVEAMKGRGENDRKADSCGETERTKITMKREVRGANEIEEEEVERSEDRRDREEAEGRRKRR